MSRIETPLKLTIIFSYDYITPHLLLSLIKKASKIAHLHGPQTGLGHFEFKLHTEVYLHKLGNYPQFGGQKIAVTNYVSKKTFVLKDISVDLESRELLNFTYCEMAPLSCGSPSSVRLIQTRSSVCY